MEVVLPGPVERALKWEYDPVADRWSKQVIKVVIDGTPFAEGSLRQAYRMQIVENDGSRANYVGKVSKDVCESRETYHRDVQAQMVAKKWAQEYNKKNPPKKIDFVDCFVLELATRPGRPLMGVEMFVEGVFQKHNSNVGGKGSEERNTPNAFSHFSWEASGNKLLVCDIQGVGDLYTDPQVHTANGQGFGRGNLGMTGIRAFLMRHQCNVICEYLGLTATTAGAPQGRDPPPLLRLGTPLQNSNVEPNPFDIIVNKHQKENLDFLSSNYEGASSSNYKATTTAVSAVSSAASMLKPASPETRKPVAAAAARAELQQQDDLDESDEMMMESILNDLESNFK